MVELAQGWELEVDRGPDWLFVRVHCRGEDAADEVPPLAETIWSILDQQFCHRLVLELDEVQLLHSYLVGQLVLLHKRLTTHGGVMRVCGLSSSNQQVLHLCRLDDRFPHYEDREHAVLGQRPHQPR